MLKTRLRAFLLMAAVMLTAPTFAQDSEETIVEEEATLVEETIESTEETTENAEEESLDMTAVIMDHIKDAHHFHIMDIEQEDGTEKMVDVPLPVILLDGGLQIFSSSRLYHDGEAKTLSNGEGYLANEELGYGIYDGKIYKLENGLIHIDEEGTVLNAKPMDFSITKNVFTLIFTAILLFFILSATLKSYNKEAGAPKGIAKFVEPMVIFVRDDIAKANIGEEKYKKFLPYLLTAFFFIWIANMVGLIPVFPGGANLTGNIGFTLALAMFTLVLTVFSGNKHYWGHIFAMPGVPKPLLLIMIPVEIIGVLAKPFALMVRLFANMTAGHIILLSLTGIIFTFGSAAWAGLSIPMSLFIYVLKLLVAFLQAFIFTMLSALFIGEAVAVEHD